MKCDCGTPGCPNEIGIDPMGGTIITYSTARPVLYYLSIEGAEQLKKLLDEFIALRTPDKVEDIGLSGKEAKEYIASILKRGEES